MHTPYSELAKKIQEAQKKVEVGALYHHWKDANTHYKVLSIGFTEWDEGLVVVYQNVANGITWIRRLEGEDGWLTPVDREGDDKSRFIRVK